MNILQNITSSHQFILDAVSQATPFTDPVTFSPGQYEWPLLKAAKKGRAIPIDGVLVPDWNPYVRKSYPGLVLGARTYSIEGITFVNVQFECNYNLNRVA